MSRHSCQDEGFTLVEVMAALLVFIIVSTATVGLLIMGLRTVRQNTERVQAATVARTQLDSLRQRGAALVPVGVSTTVPAGTNARFSVRTTAQWVALGQGSASACQALTPGQAYLRVRVEVSSPALTGPQALDSVIVPEPGKGPGSSTGAPSGAVAISVLDQLGQPVRDVTVSATDTAQPTNAFTLTTGSDGCLYLPSLLTSGSLKVTVSRSGYVASTPTGSSQTVQVTTGGLTRVGFSYAAASSLQFMSGVPGFTLPGSTPVTWQPNATGATAQTSVVSSGPTGLWPATTGFTAWLGRCTDSRPDAYGASSPSFGFTAGGVSPAPLPGAPVILTGITPLLAVTATYAGPDSTCAGSTIDLGRADAFGQASVLLPYGRWTIAAGGQSRPTGVLTPSVAGTTPVAATLAFSLFTASPSPSGASPSGASPSGSPSPTGTP